MELEQAQQRAERARQLLDDPLLKDTFSLAHEALIRAVKSAKTPDEAFKATIALQVFDLIKGQLESHIETGKIMEYNFKKPLKERLGF